MSKKQILLVEKNGTVKEIQVAATLHDLHKKAGFKTNEGFHEQFVWEIQWEDNKYTVSLFAKKTGRIPKNTYGFPPPLEETVFYGNCLLVCAESDLSVKVWDNIFEAIYEKYDDDGLEDEEEEGSDGIPLLEDEDGSDNGSDDEEEEDEVEDDEEAKRVVKKKKNKTSSRKKEDAFLLVADPPAAAEQFLDCSSELELEPYLV